jgi:hypothetical protein
MPACLDFSVYHTVKDCGSRARAIPGSYRRLPPQVAPDVHRGAILDCVWSMDGEQASGLNPQAVPAERR